MFTRIDRMPAIDHLTPKSSPPIAVPRWIGFFLNQAALAP
jgi:hypothetical protein